MATNTGELYINLKADISELKKGLDLARKDINTFDKNMSRAAKGARDLQKSFVAFAASAVSIYAVGSALKSLVSSSLSFNAEMEQAAATLYAVTSASKGYVDTTGQTVTAMQRHAAISKETEGALEGIQKVMTQTASSMQDLITSYALMKPAMDRANVSQKEQINLLKLTANTAATFGLDMNQLSTGIDDLASGTWKASSGFGKMMKSIGVTTDGVKNATNVYQYLADAMRETGEEQDTMNVAMSNFGESWAILKGKLTEGIFDQLKDSLNIVRKEMDTYGPKAMQQFANALVDMVNGGLKVLGFLVKAVNAVIQSFKIAWAGYSKIAGTLMGGDVSKLQTELSELQRKKAEGDYGFMESRSKVNVDIRNLEKAIVKTREYNELRIKGDKAVEEGFKSIVSVNELVNTQVKRFTLEYKAVTKEIEKTVTLQNKLTPGGTGTTGSAAKASKARISAAKKESKARIKAEKDWLKAVKDVTKQAEKARRDADAEEKRAVEDFTQYSTMLLTGVFDSLIDGDMQGAFEGVFQSLLGTLTQFVSEALVQTLILGQAFATTAIAHAAAQTTWVGLAAMAAAMIALGFAANSGGGGGGGNTSYSMPSYSQVSQGSSGESQKALNSEGAYLSLVDYNAILKIAEYNQTDFNAALGEYNNLVSEAHQIWESASSSLRKWGREITDYNEALEATQSVGSFDALNEFFDTVATADEQIAYLSKTVDVLAADAGVAGLSIEAMSEYIKYLISVGDQVSMAQANRIAKLGNAQNELNEARASAAKDAADAITACNKAMEEAARAARELRQSITGLMADWMESVQGGHLILQRAIKETGITGVTDENFLDRFTTASALAGFTEEDLENWNQLSEAIKNYANALEEAAQEEAEALKMKLQAELAAINTQITFYEGILSRIESAYSGSLSYFNSLEKIAYLGELAVTKFGAGDTQGYFNTLYSQLEHEKKMSATREDYTLSFESYILELKNAEPEATLDDVVDEIKESNIKLDNLTDAIAESSYQKA